MFKPTSDYLNVRACGIAPNILEITPPGEKEVIRIDPTGRLFWHGREVDTDADSRGAMLELAEYLMGRKR